MSITIFASGKIDHIEDIQRLVDELKGIAHEHKWTCHIIDDGFDLPPSAVLTHGDSDKPNAVIKGSLGLKGIVLNVETGVEPFSILFDRSGVLTDMLQQVSWISCNGQHDRFTMCKTQFGNIDSHILIIEILLRLKEMYITDLTVYDEGFYWKSRDRRLLAGKRIMLGHYLRLSEKVISSIEISGEDTRDPEKLATRIEEGLRKAHEEDGSKDIGL